MTALALDAIQPDHADIETAVEVLPRVQDYLARHHGRDTLRIVVEDNGQESEILTVPRSAVELLARVLAHMAAGEGVSVVPSHAELTTQQAADMLNVSRPFLIGLLDSDEIEYRKVGKHRRIQARSLIEYMRADDRHRRSAADELTRLSQELGLD